MINIKDLRHDLIGLIMQINNSDTLISAYQDLNKKTDKHQSSFEGLIVEVLPLPSLNEIIDDQHTTQLSFSDLCERSERIDWEFSLDEMLAGLN